ncbi:efflux RND transporter periplasmic adaptor subunit [Shewanella sp. SR43-4]|uniref:Efflux RND transporter periplasmic adaptor subunit n=1 Tax=Shewanella vesiculosa TaxID=518738 RepID=A0ABV0FT29_9GAMM|nr:efflux RND transporter periplasmic adaptor subunit [Shewanella sp. SR43-4]MBB1316426.1 efflux RND transporter periplasmic adaptor subunit [Shewanella sp. SR43-4]|tara:strand:- start:559 stop:1767 length:1209 start_codon:yes stop_codon:yes gene_type:complete
MKLNRLNVIVTVLSLGSIFAALGYTVSQLPPAPNQQASATEQPINPVANTAAISLLPQVGVVAVNGQQYQAEVIGFGEARPRYELTLNAEVSGKIDSVHRQFESGQVIKKGTVLGQINDISYQQALTQAQTDVAQAELDLLEEQRQGEQAKSEWLRSGFSGEPESPLVLRTPQLAQATAALENAKLTLKKAKQDVAYTKITAPFDALVVSRDIQPGSYVQTGTQLGTLYSVADVEINVPLSDLQWQNLPEFDNAQLAKTPWDVTLYSADGRNQWQGYIERVEQHLTQTSRQRSLIVVVDNPLTQQTHLYPGTFVKAQINGKSLSDLWQLPSSAISQQGDIWFINDSSQLAKSAANIAFEKDGFVYVLPIVSEQRGRPSLIQIVKRPLSSFKVGTKVLAKLEV